MKKERKVHDKNKPVAIVTGGAHRLGGQIALELARAGFDVAFTFLSARQKALKTLRSLGDLGSNPISISTDMRKPAQIRSMVRRVFDKYGRIDLLVNNAAIFPSNSFLKTNPATWDAAMETNLRGVFLCSQEVAQFMLKRKSGCIVNISSLGGLQPWEEHTAYSVSKAGVIMLTRCMAKALAPHVRVNAIAPGTIIIPGEENPKLRHISRKKIPLRKYGRPLDISKLVIYLALTSEYITGQTISVDGGRNL